jgi:hypothetical protein
MRASAFGITTPRESVSTWGAGLGGALLTARLSKTWALRLDADLSVPSYRPSFAIEGLGPVHQPSDVTLQVGAGAAVHF